MRPELPKVRQVIETGGDYEAALAAASRDRPSIARSNDDHYVIYTGGTTGLPKGVVWRHEDAFFACIGGGDPMRLGTPIDAPEQLPDRMIEQFADGFADVAVCRLKLHVVHISRTLCSSNQRE